MPIVFRMSETSYEYIAVWGNEDNDGKFGCFRTNGKDFYTNHSVSELLILFGFKTGIDPMACI